MRTLATLAEVKQWAGVKPEVTTADALLTRLLEGATQFVYSVIQREFIRKTYNDTYDGYGMGWMVLRQYPVISVEAVSANGIPYIPATGNGITVPYTNGFVMLNDRLVLFGYVFPRQRNSIFVRYDAGYYISDEEATVPGVSTYTVTTSQHWLANGAVTLADGTELTEVASAPGALEYTAVDGVYTFNVAQAGAAVLISYSYVPADVVDAVINLVGERYKYMDRIGYNSKTLGGQETVSFSQNKAPDWVNAILLSYKRVVPI